jgi:hypothetical protein
LAAVLLGREPCRAALRQGLLALNLPPVAGAPAAPDASGAAEPTGARTRSPPHEAWLVDHQFGDWPLDEAGVLDSLSTWMRPGGRCLRIVGQDFETTARRLPRFARWRRDWSHRIEVLRPADGVLPARLRGLIAGGCAWHWLEAPDWRLRPITDAVQVRAMQEQLADFLQRCEPAWPATVLGL